MSKWVVELLLICLLGSGTVFAFAQEEPGPASANIVISTGLEGGGYWNAGGRLQAAARGLELGVDNLASSGSRLSLQRLYDEGSPVSLAFAQADALQYFLNRKPEAADLFEELETIGEECVFIISERDGDIATDKDMQKADRLHLGIKSPQSGIWVTFNYMATLVPELGNVSLIYGDTVEKMNELAHPLTNIDRAVMVVHGTNAHSPEVDMAAANPDKFRFVKITDSRLTAGASSTQPVYQRKKVKSGVATEARAVETICVQGLLLANKKKLTATQRDTLKKMVSEHWDEIHLQ